MPSLLIWHKDTGEILACMQRPKGDAPVPTARKTLWHRPDLLPHIESAWIGADMTTLQAQQQLEIVDGTPIWRR